MSTKYRPLQAHLQAQSSSKISITFKEIEKIIGAKLPPSARAHRAWWSNDPKHSVAKAWLPTGYRSAQVNMRDESLVFRRERGYGVDLSRIAAAGAVQDSENGGTRYGFEFYGCMKGLITIADGHDLTEPADPDWGKRADASADAEDDG